MAATPLTLAAIFGADSKISRTGDNYLADVQNFSFSGIDGVFSTALGARGRTISWSGLLRVSGASNQDAAANLSARVATITDLYIKQTLVDLTYAMTNTSDLYLDPAPTIPFEGVVSAFSETAPRSVGTYDQLLWWAVVPFSLQFTRLN